MYPSGISIHIGGKHTLLSAGLLDLGSGTDADETVVRLELLQGLAGVVDESEAGALATTVLGAESEDRHLVLLGLVQRAELVAELILGDVGAVGVEDVTGRERVFVSFHFYPIRLKFFSFFANYLCKCANPASSIIPSSQNPTQTKESLQNHLSPRKQRVADELARPQGNGSVGHDVVERVTDCRQRETAV